MLSTLIRFLFPCRCAICGHLLGRGNLVICPSCIMQLPMYKCDSFIDNEMARIFWKRLPIVRATSWMYYNPGTRSSELVTGPKYAHRDDIAYSVGMLIADCMSRSGFFEGIDTVVPMPTTKQREEERGMNQVQEVAHSMVQALHRDTRYKHIHLEHDTVKRTTFRQSQTRRQRHERVESVTSDDFKVTKPERLDSRHVLILDDVVTTGTTAAALGEAITKAAHNVRISILAIGRTNET